MDQSGSRSSVPPSGERDFAMLGPNAEELVMRNSRASLQREMDMMDSNRLQQQLQQQPHYSHHHGANPPPPSSLFDRGDRAQSVERSLGHLTQPAQHRQQQQAQFSTGIRRGADARVVQAVQPLSLLDRDKLDPDKLPDSCQVTKQLLREAQTQQGHSRAAGAPSPGPTSGRGGGAPPPPPAYVERSTPTSDASVQSMIDNYQMRAAPSYRSAVDSLNRSRSSLTDSGRPQRQSPANFESVDTNGHTPPPPPTYSTATTAAASTEDNSLASSAADLRAVLSPVAFNLNPSEASASATARIIDTLSQENKNMKLQVQAYQKKSVKVEQLELHYKRIFRKYEELEEHQRKRDALHEETKNKLLTELSRLQAENWQLQNDLQHALLHAQSRQEEAQSDETIRMEISQANLLISDLLHNNKELLACKERQEIELQAQSTTLDEQRAHIHILDQALRNAQEKVLRLEDELKKRGSLLEHAKRLEQALTSLQLEALRKEENFKRDKAMLEKELAQLSIQKSKNDNTGSVARQRDQGRSNADLEELLRLRREVEEKDAQLDAMRSDAFHGAHDYYQQFERDNAVLEREAESRDEHMQNLQDSKDNVEKLLAESRLENEQQRSLIGEQKAQMAMLQSQLSKLESKLAQRDATINVLKTKNEAEREADEYSDDATLTAADWSPTGYTDYSSEDVRRRLMANVKHRLLQSPGRLPSDSSAPPVLNYSSLDRPGRHFSTTKRGAESWDLSALHSRTHSDTRNLFGLGRPATKFSATSTFTHPENRSRLASNEEEPRGLSRREGRRPLSFDDHLLLSAEEEAPHTPPESESNSQTPTPSQKEELWNV